MLLNQVEKHLALDIEVLEKKIQKTPVCESSYIAQRGIITPIDDNNFYYLKSTTSIMINGYPFTTFTKQYLYNGTTRKKVPNSSFTVDCSDKEVEVNYENVIHYLHLPDFIATYVIHKRIQTLAVQPYTILNFYDGVVKVYNHKVKVATPYYLFDGTFKYTPQADLLAKIIGLFDAFKRGELSKINASSIKHFIYPFVSLIVYKKLHTTIYPSFINSSINLLLNDIGGEVNELLKGYQYGKSEEKKRETYNEITNLIDAFNENNQIIE